MLGGFAEHLSLVRRAARVVLMWSHVPAEVNYEVWDPKLDEAFVEWHRVETCPIEGCTHFKNAKAWSLESAEKAIAYCKHHLITCSAEKTQDYHGRGRRDVGWHRSNM